MAGARDIKKEYKGVTIQTRGLSKMSRALKKAGQDSENMRDLMHKLGMIVVEEARTLVPVASGRIRDSIRAGRGATKAVVRAGYKNMPYAPVIHYGGENPNPFMLDALVNKRQEVIDTYEDEFLRMLSNNGFDARKNFSGEVIN